MFEVAYRHVTLDETTRGWEIVLRDISVHKQAGRELHRALLRERELVALKSQFVQLVSHEFRTPLATIMLSNDLLRKYDPTLPDDKKQVYWDRISQAVKHMRHMLDDVSTVNRIDTDRFGFNPEYFDLLGLCESLVNEQRDIASEAHVLIFAASGGCPRVYMDPQLIRHIVENLLSNAIKYSPDGGTITLTLTCDEKYVTLQISDEGLGIHSSDLPFLFDQFHRGKNVEHIRGTGLGLAIVKTCVETHNGTIQVQSAIDKGSIFTVTLPKYNLR
ncbi:HAMP domain-containing histidine kinase [bacterium]|nr:HAMP domain-containing histidine kinase [bacterium]